MTSQHKQGLIKKQGLTQAELKDIKQLADICNAYEKLDLKLNWDTLQTRPQDHTNDFLYYEQDQLVGFLGLFSFNSREGEISGMVHPEHRRRGIFTRLFQAAADECLRRGLQRILLIVERASHSGQAFAQTLGTHYDHTEHKMVLKEVKMPAFDERLRFRKAGSEDVQALAHITAIAFDMLEQEVSWYTANVMDRSERSIYIGSLDGVSIGKIDVSFEENEAIIYGFGVLPEYRGRGYGRQILARTIQEILASGQQHIALEVATENSNALSLYQSCGFQETGSYDYYSVIASRA